MRKTLPAVLLLSLLVALAPWGGALLAAPPPSAPAPAAPAAPAPLAPVGAPPNLPAARAGSEAAAQAAAAAGALAHADPAAALLAVQGIPSADLPAPPAATFEEALAALYAQAGISATPAAPADPQLADAAAPVVAAVAAASATVRDATAALGPDGAKRLWDDLVAAWRPNPHPTLEDLQRSQAVADAAGTVDVPAMAAAAAALLEALERFLPPPTPAPMGWTDPAGLIEIGGTGNDCAYTTERVLLIDLGGDDCYNNHAATATPRSAIPLPVSVLLEVGGNDAYFDSAPHANDPAATWSQAVGVAGIGILYDRWGNDRYSVSLANLALACSGWHRQTVLGQGVGVFGVGALVDLGGDDRYAANNQNFLTSGCHFNTAYLFAQAASVEGGAGLLLDDLGNDRYSANTDEWGEDADNNAHTNAQAAAGRGVAVLVDKEGHDRYSATAGSGATGGGFHKGSHAYVYAQAVTYATLEVPFGNAAGGIPACSLSAQNPNPAQCIPIGCPGVPISHQARLTSPCPPAFAALVDLLGDDSFDAHPTSSVATMCTVTSRAVAVAQGAAAWPGAAVLAVVDEEGTDTFRSLPGAVGNGAWCLAEAHAYVQGFAGEHMWDRFDGPGGNDGLLVGVLLSPGPPYLYACPTVPKPGEPAPPWPTGTLPAVAAALNALIQGACGSLGLPPSHGGILLAEDHYVAQPTATNTGGPAQAIVWAQGVAQGQNQTVAGGVILPPQIFPNPKAPALPATLPVGVLVDVAGNDTYDATATATGTTVTSQTYAQGATVDGVAILAEVGGHDTYDAWAVENGVANLLRSHAQAFADGTLYTLPFTFTGCLATIPIPGTGGTLDLQCVTLPTDLLAVGVFVEIFGQDTYSEAAERVVGAVACQDNGPLAGGWPLGDPLPGGDDGLGTVWWGHLLVHPCKVPPTPTAGNGITVGLDWASDVAVV